MNRIAAQQQAWHNGQPVHARNEGAVIPVVHQQRAGDPLPEIRGFVRSPFNPLVYHSVQQAVRAAGREEGGWPDPARVGIALGSMFVDAVTEEESWHDILQGKKLSPIMFPQSVPSAIIGLLTRELAIHGPMTCLGSSRNNWSIMLDMATDWITSDYADIVVLTACDVPSLRSRAWEEAQGTADGWIGGAMTVILERTEHALGRGRLQGALSLQQFRQRYVGHKSALPAHRGLLGSCWEEGES
ncbi:hypothetical protein DUZ99_19320 [Xylanibacillus composti]|uniref:Beta-ketoacyl synthase N-terminal domain-containing protein n=1 Tax=Xylanibacillus composti TaxID=1572762 RepID=A0A8J4M2T7_9BACL|nr:hypothetical protein [Xylanibacillus composti]MDT9727118.1 hypothetical protein [Xylanibacillus composti]GIQ68871.1 hypothetical protein XYCOK13_16950 [Xylanibacillus composti]